MALAFVTGGTGFLGRRMVEMLLERGWSVRALHRSPADAATPRALGAEPVQGDLDDTPALRRGMAGADTVFHCAALFTMWAPHADFERANVDGTRNLLAAAQAEHVARFIQIGAAAVFMKKRESMIAVTEDAPLAHPSWAPYIASKARAQALVLGADRADGMRTAMILPPMIWGARMPMLDHVVANFAAGQFAWPGGGKSRMSTAHVDNVCHGAILAAEKMVGGHAYFVSDGKDRTMREVMTALVATRGVEAKARDVPAGVAWFLATIMETMWRTFRRKGEPPLTRQMLRMVSFDFTVSDRQARQELGYTPKVSWEEGIAEMSSSTRIPSQRHAR
ncbi:NAD-dependent epimerase/dehydratase family protein [Aminobacter sp. MSH1]|uniref:NAD-dependent epimerase/dehydratase family protein n=1 Tax=Aminobacter sp. MSH1 TaxID=374606 RepID=UPI000D340CBF|nr:NAD-dependent epimerase/dehydratase family protein [Aminobacter sp. MSH1]